ncbi:MAG: hypothetical protein NTY36_06280 [Deltaproteobacteria bacterium]|nr:hypothetical protein [Deltaproteobacteria bacterium]
MKQMVTKFLVVALVIIGVYALYPSPADAGTLSDNFDGAAINTQLWWVPPYHYDEHQRCLQQGGVLKIQIDGVSTGGSFGAGLGSCFDLKGDFAIVVDYNAINWPYSNGVGAGIQYMGTKSSVNGHMTRRSFGADDPPPIKENYVTDFMDGNFLDHAQIATSDSQGKMKLTRVGKVMTGYFWQNNTWVKVGSHDYSLTGLDDWLVIGLNANSSTGYQMPDGTWVHPFAHKDVEMDFDNWRVTYDQIRYYSSGGPAPGILQLLLD